MRSLQPLNKDVIRRQFRGILRKPHVSVLHYALMSKQEAFFTVFF